MYISEREDNKENDNPQRVVCHGGSVMFVFFRIRILFEKDPKAESKNN